MTPQDYADGEIREEERSVASWDQAVREARTRSVEIGVALGREIRLGARDDHDGWTIRLGQLYAQHGDAARLLASRKGGLIAAETRLGLAQQLARIIRVTSEKEPVR
jgi:hypothetical protein